MKIHLAGSYPSLRNLSHFTRLDDKKRDILLTFPYLLESYHYIGNSDKYLKHIRADNRKIFLDSGAFSAFTKNAQIDLPKYCRFIKDNEDIIEVASVLDGIGDPKLTLENQKKMEDLGARPLPCFHYGEPVEYLEHYIENYDHMTLGGMVPISTKDLKVWLDEIWGKYLTDENGMPKLKVHGFGLTVLSLMTRYPWYSVDSTSWIMTGSFGSIYWPTAYAPENKLTISSESPRVRDFGQHYDTLTGIEKLDIERKIEAKGFKIQEMREDYYQRWLWNIDYFRGLCDTETLPFINKEQGLF